MNEDSQAIVFSDKPTTMEEYNYIRRTLGWFEYRVSAELQEALDRSLYYVTVYCGGRVIGMGRVVGDGRITFYVQDIMVVEPFRGKGIGRGIMERIMKFIHSRAIDNAVIGLMSAVGKEPFYEKFDFFPRPNEHFGKGMMQFHKDV